MHMSLDDVNSAVVAALIAPEKYLAERANVFPSLGSLQWYMRQRRAGLAQCGAMLMIGGRLLVHPGRFDAFVVEHGAVPAAVAGAVQ
jgi:hypothetical protein